MIYESGVAHCQLPAQALTVRVRDRKSRDALSTCSGCSECTETSVQELWKVSLAAQASGTQQRLQSPYRPRLIHGACRYARQRLCRAACRQDALFAVPGSATLELSEHAVALYQHPAPDRGARMCSNECMILSPGGSRLSGDCKHFCVLPFS